MSKDVRMSLSEWEALRKSNHDEWLEKYWYFMYHNRVCRCEECPANQGFPENGRHPCGQYHCWVDAHRN